MNHPVLELNHFLSKKIKLEIFTFFFLISAVKYNCCYCCSLIYTPIPGVSEIYTINPSIIRIIQNSK